MTLNTEQDGQAALLPPLSQPYVMEDWLVMPELNRLQNRLTNEIRSVEPRLMHLLCYLAANTANVLDRDCLVDHLWPNVIVNENSLTRAVSELRKQLRTGCRMDAIETIPKRGYRLLCKVKKIEPAQARIASLSNKPKDSKLFNYIRSRMFSDNSVVQSARPALVGLTLGALLTAIAAINFSNSPAFSDSPVNLTPSPRTLADEIVIAQPSYLGGQLALSSAKIGNLAVRSASRPVVSHDGSSYAYLGYDQTGSTIFIGTLNEVADPHAIFHDSEKLLNLAWSPVGQSLLFTKQSNINPARLSNSQAESQLLILDLKSGKLQRLVESDLPKNQHAIHENNLT